MDTIIMQLGVPAVAASVICFILGICLAVIVQQIISKSKGKNL